MRTQKQTAASRANGALSKGPASTPGKLNSARNSLRHGLLARTVVLDEESTARFHELLQALMDEFHPTSPTQLMLVETMAAARWRLLRVWGLQKVALDREIALQDPSLGQPAVLAALAFGKSAETPQPDLLLRYEVAYDRQYHRALKSLLALQSNPVTKPVQPYEPVSLPGHTWEDGPTPSEPEPSIPEGVGPQRREPTPQGASPDGEGSDAAALRASKNVPSPPFAAKSVFSERTRQPDNPQRREPAAQGGSPDGEGSDLAVLRVLELNPQRRADDSRRKSPAESSPSV